jgi:glycogen debranching enzyme
MRIKANLMNYYLYFDNPTVERTLLALRGKDPVTSHINTIMDYTFYWFIGIYDYYLYTGDRKFIQQFYPRMQSMMEYCLSRRNKNGMMEGLAGTGFLSIGPMG